MVYANKPVNYDILFHSFEDTSCPKNLGGVYCLFTMLNLLVIKSQDLTKSVAFYTLLGLKFIEEQHGKGPVHFAAQMDGGTVFEIYPANSAEKVTQNIRLGFVVEDLDKTLQSLIAAGFRIAQPAAQSRWGYRAVAIDPEGRKVELTELEVKRYE